MDGLTTGHIVGVLHKKRTYIHTLRFKNDKTFCKFSCRKRIAPGTLVILFRPTRTRGYEICRWDEKHEVRGLVAVTLLKDSL